jgi:hypothetical protein
MMSVVVYNHSDVAMISVLDSSVVYRGSSQRLYNWSSAKQADIRSESKYWSTRNQKNISEWSDISTRKLLFQSAS